MSSPQEACQPLHDGANELEVSQLFDSGIICHVPAACPQLYLQDPLAMASSILAPTHIYRKNFRRKEDPPKMFPPESLELAMTGCMVVAKIVEHT